jgi:hypothetical protein
MEARSEIARARLRLNFMWINFVNVQRSNFVRAHTVSERGLARQAVLAVAVEASISATFRGEWEQIRPWNSLASIDYTREVDDAIADYTRGAHREYAVGGHAERRLTISPAGNPSAPPS